MFHLIDHLHHQHTHLYSFHFASTAISSYIQCWHTYSVPSAGSPQWLVPPPVCPQSTLNPTRQSEVARRNPTTCRDRHALLAGYLIYSPQNGERESCSFSAFCCFVRSHWWLREDEEELVDLSSLSCQRDPLFPFLSLLLPLHLPHAPSNVPSLLFLLLLLHLLPNLASPFVGPLVRAGLPINEQLMPLPHPRSFTRSRTLTRTTSFIDDDLVHSPPQKRRVVGPKQAFSLAALLVLVEETWGCHQTPPTDWVPPNPAPHTTLFRPVSPFAILILPLSSADDMYSF
jgi:hypothetical protein